MNKRSASDSCVSATEIELFLSDQIDARRAECLNVSKEHSLRDMILNSNSLVERANTDNYVESADDEQLILFLPFKQKHHLRSIRFYAPNSESCPRTIRLFVNRPHMDFDSVESLKADQEIVLSGEEATRNPVKPIALKGTHFRNVNSLTVFVRDNHGADTTMIYKMKLVGTLAEDTSRQKLQKAPVTTHNDDPDLF